MITQFGKRRRSSDVCVICTERPATTKEDIPPQSLFLTVPPDYLRVPACYECNNSTKLEDEHLRHVMAGASWSPEGQAMWAEKVRPKLQSHPGTRIGLGRNLTHQKVDLFELGEVELPVLQIEAKRIDTSVRKLVWGLYWFHTGNVLPRDVPLGVRFLNISQVTKHFENPGMNALFKKTAPGVYRDPEVIRTFFYTGAAAGKASLWYFFFYRQNVIIAYTGAAAN